LLVGDSWPFIGLKIKLGGFGGIANEAKEIKSVITVIIFFKLMA
jgi:hypothetical protein